MLRKNVLDSINLCCWHFPADVERLQVKLLETKKARAIESNGQKQCQPIGIKLNILIIL